MRTAFNPFTGNIDFLGGNFLGVYSTAPSNPNVGDTYINSSNDTYYIYYAGLWQVIAVLSSSGGNVIEDTSGNVITDTSGNIVTDTN